MTTICIDRQNHLICITYFPPSVVTFTTIFVLMIKQLTEARPYRSQACLDSIATVVITESREFLSDGQAASLSQFQTGSVSTYELNGVGVLRPISLDIPTSSQMTTG